MGKSPAEYTLDQLQMDHISFQKTLGDTLEFRVMTGDQVTFQAPARWLPTSPCHKASMTGCLGARGTHGRDAPSTAKRRNSTGKAIVDGTSVPKMSQVAPGLRPGLTRSNCVFPWSVTQRQVLHLVSVCPSSSVALGRGKTPALRKTKKVGHPTFCNLQKYLL